MTINSNKTLMLITRKGFRHTTVEQRFISSQLNWTYTSDGRKLANITRLLMSMAMVQAINSDRNKRGESKIKTKDNRQVMPHTYITLSTNTSGRHVATEQLYIEDTFKISFIETRDAEVVEINNIVSGDEAATKPSDLAVYLKDIAEKEVNTRMSNGGSFTDFIIYLTNLIAKEDTWLVPLAMVYNNNEESHNFSITLVPRELHAKQCLKINVRLY